MLNLDIPFTAALAGFIGADGSITIGNHYRGSKSYYHIRVQVTQTDELLLKSFKETTGVGSVQLAHGEKGGRAAAWVWAVNGKDAKDLLETIQPYMLSKKKQAELAVDMYKAWQFIDHDKRDYDYFEACKIEMGILNSRGSSAYKNVFTEKNAKKNAAYKQRELEKHEARQTELASRVCERCGTSLKGLHYHAKFCSRECVVDNWKDKQNADKVERDCPECGGLIPKTAPRNKKFCSANCQQNARRKLVGRSDRKRRET